jgi:hypothetical protein
MPKWTAKFFIFFCRWTQKLTDVTVNVPVPKGTRGKMIDVVIQNQRLKVGLKGQPSIIDGELFGVVKTADCAWTLGAFFFFGTSSFPLQIASQPTHLAPIVFSLYATNSSSCDSILFPLFQRIKALLQWSLANSTLSSGGSS